MTPALLAPGAPRDAPSRWGRRHVVGVLLLTSALVLLALTVASWLDPTGYDLLAPFGHAPGVGAVAAVLLVVGGVLRPLHRLLGLAAVVTGVVGFGLAVPLAFVWSSWSLDPSLTATGPAAGVEARVFTGADGIDPLWSVRVHSGHGLTARATTVACFDGDDPDEALDRVRWTGPASLEVRSSSGRTWSVPVDPRTGRPTADQVVGTC